MRTKAHWNECNNMASYHAAQNLALQLREKAKASGYDPRGIKVITREFTNKSGYHADSIVAWKDGPMNWANQTDFITIPGVHIEPRCDVVTFYDV